MTPRSSFSDATVAAALCETRDWYPKTESEDSEEVESRRHQKLPSVLSRSCETDVPAPQKEFMNCNLSIPALLSLPQNSGPKFAGSSSAVSRCGLPSVVPGVEYKKLENKSQNMGAQQKQSSQWSHQLEYLQHNMATKIHRANCLAYTIYAETTLLPYAINTFTFENDSVRRLFERSARPGKKRAQDKAIGNYEIGTWSGFRARHLRRGPWRGRRLTFRAVSTQWDFEEQ